MYSGRRRNKYCCHIAWNRSWFVQCWLILPKASMCLAVCKSNPVFIWLLSIVTYLALSDWLIDWLLPSHLDFIEIWCFPLHFTWYVVYVKVYWKQNYLCIWTDLLYFSFSLCFSTICDLKSHLKPLLFRRLYTI